jgi:hypothetical protein
MITDKSRFVLACATVILIASLSMTAQAQRPIGHFQTIPPSPNPTVFVVDPAPPGDPSPEPAGLVFQTFGDNANSGYGDVEGQLQYVPGLCDDAQDFVDADFQQGNIAICDRGAVTFASKVQLADAAGAIGAVIANDAGENRWVSLSLGNEVTNIPSILVTNATGQSLINDLDAGVPLHAHMRVVPEPSTFAIGLLAAGGCGLLARRRRRRM